MVEINTYRRPAPLKQADKVAVIAPATKVKHEYVAGAARWIAAKGFTPVVMPHSDGASNGSFAASRMDRLSDLLTSLRDPEIKAILCARGGYGCQQLLPDIPVADVAEGCKWIIGFSDISALHALWLSAGVMALHAPMGKHMTLLDDDCTDRIASILRGEALPAVECASHPLNIEGSSNGTLAGGNLAVLNGLAATPYDILSPNRAEGSILFIEDIGENIYEIDRILTRLAMAGTLNGIRGLAVGQFTEYHEDLNYADMEEMIRTRLDQLALRYGFSFPVAFNLPIGHVDRNFPVVEGARCRLDVTPHITRISYE